MSKEMTLRPITAQVDGKAEDQGIWRVLSRLPLACHAYVVATYGHLEMFFPTLRDEFGPVG
jgi:hypothetical protein